MDSNSAWCLFVGIIASAFLIYYAIGAIAEVKLAKYESFSPSTEFMNQVDALNSDVDLALIEFMEWLDEKGVKREGFRNNDQLVDEFKEWRAKL